jgi:putative transcriptional regulator
MGERKLKVIDLARDLDIHRNAITLLYNETATRVDLNLVGKLCEYFDCEISDLFEYIKNDKPG